MVVTNYWTSSKVRIQHWLTALKMFEQDFESGDEYNSWSAAEIVIQEIFISEVLTRVWSALVLIHDKHHQTDELHGLAHSVFLGHSEAKNRALRMLIQAEQVDSERFERMNRLRRRLERWTDLLLGNLPHAEIAAMFAYHPKRVRDYCQEKKTIELAEQHVRKKVLLASFAADLLRDTNRYSANPDLNQDVITGILACYPADRFDASGLPKSVKQLWFEKAHNDTQLLIDHIQAFDLAATQEHGLADGRW